MTRNSPCKNLVRTALIALIMVPQTVSLAQELRKEGRYYVAEVTNSFKLQPGGELRIYDVRGDVRVSTWDKNEVFIRELKRMDVFTENEAQTVLERSKSSYRQRDNIVEIGGEHYSRDWIRTNFEVTVPRKFNLDIGTREGDLEVKSLAGEVQLATSGGDITLEDIDGQVDAKTSGGDVRVRNSTQRVTVKTSGGDLDLENIGGELMARTSGGDIILRGSKSELELHTSGGDIDIRDAGGDLRAHTSGGDIEIMNTIGTAEVHTSGGDIKFRNVGGSLEASTSGGDIGGEKVNGHAEVSTSGGTIELTEVNGGVRAKTSGGDVIVEVTLKDFSKPHPIDLRASGGDIRLTIPAEMPASIRAEIEISDRWQDYNIYSDFPLTSTEDSSKEEDREDRRRHRSWKFIRSEGDINGGGDRIDISTSNGSIYLKKLAR